MGQENGTRERENNQGIMSEVGEVVPSKTVARSDMQVDLARAAESDTLPLHFLRVPAVDTVFLLLSVSCQVQMLNWRLLCWSRTVATRRRGCTNVDLGKLTHQVGVERLPRTGWVLVSHQGSGSGRAEREETS